MKQKCLRLLAGGLFAFSIATTSQAGAEANLLTRLVRMPLVAAPALSGDGHFLSALVRQANGESRVAVWAVGASLATADVLPYDRLEVNWMAWIGGGRLLLSLAEKGLVLYDPHIRRLRPLIEQDGPRPNELPPLLLSSLPDDPEVILMQWEDPGVPGFPAVYRVNSVAGTSEKIVSAWRPIIRWWASPAGEAVMGEGYEGRTQNLYSRRTDGSWVITTKRDYFTGPAHSVLAVEPGGATALILAVEGGSDKRDLWRMSVADGAMITRLAEHNNFDIAAALIDPVTDQAVGASYIADRQVDAIWQAARHDELIRLSDKYGLKGLGLSTASRDGRRLLLRSRADHRPPVYYLYDYDEDSLSPLPVDEGLGHLPVPKVSGVYIPVTGMKRPMHAILSRPETGESTKAILLLHGGPVSRAEAEFQPFVSWLVAHGYTVLQPNFRGSSGYGEIWRRAGYGEWGRRMQEDVRAAAEWMVETGISQPGHMCVAGGSYGGYAALLSAIMDDDLFACAVSLNGVTSLPHLVQYLGQNRFHMLTVPRIAGRLSDRTLRRRSPLYRADMVRMPVLLLHATDDTNVPFYHAKLMADALADNGKDYTFIVLKDAEHVLRRETEREQYLEASLHFFEKYLKGK